MAAKARVLAAEATSAAVREAAIALRRAQSATHARNGTVHANIHAGNASRRLDTVEADDDVVGATATAGLGIMWDWKKDGQHVFVLRRSEAELSGSTCWCVPFETGARACARLRVNVPVPTTHDRCV